MPEKLSKKQIQKAKPAVLSPQNELINYSDYFSREFPFYIGRFDHYHRDFAVIRKRRRDFWKIVYVLSGEGINIINDREFTMHAGAIYIIHPSDRTSYLVQNNNLKVINILFLPEFFRTDLQQLSDDFSFFSIFMKNYYHPVDEASRDTLYIHDSRDKSLLRIIETLEKEFYSRDLNYKFMVRSLLLILLVRLNRLAFKKKKKSAKEHIADFIQYFLERHYSREISLDNIAGACGFHRNYIGTLFKKAKGKQIFEYLNEYRILKSCELLNSTTRSVAQICYEVGFNDLSFFYRMFKRKQSLSPQKYREQHNSAV
ncbi:MAG: hypothetical protein A2096_03430 [Spirochaetes bacterium GWF1_41_5]|nr:MAG: hypothetical protein A2096_03430 [Spirochaetes bacterium GWF1_41_5]